MSAATVEMLRRQLREKFPRACGVSAGGGGVMEVPVGNATGKPVGEVRDLAGLPAGMLSEVVGLGAGWLVAAWLDGAADEPSVPELVLVDGADGFDPASFTARTCARMVWVRCRKSAMEMVKAADWVVQDGNVPLVLMDARGLDRREMAGVPASAWWRLRQAAERTGCRLVVTVAVPSVSAAGCRMRAEGGLSLADFDTTREDLLVKLRVPGKSGALRSTG